MFSKCGYGWAVRPLFSFLKDPLEHYMQNWPLKVSSGVLLSAAHVSVHHFSSCCVSLAQNLRELCSFFLCAISAISACACILPCASVVCAISVISLCYLCDLVLGTGFGSVLSLCCLCAIYAISCYICAISVLSLWYFFEIFVYTPCYLFKAWHQELAVPNLMVPWSSGPKYVLSFWWSWGDSWFVHRLGLSNCIAVWPLEAIDTKNSFPSWAWSAANSKTSFSAYSARPCCLTKNTKKNLEN